MSRLDEIEESAEFFAVNSMHHFSNYEVNEFAKQVKKLIAVAKVAKSMTECNNPDLVGFRFDINGLTKALAALEEEV